MKTGSSPKSPDDVAKPALTPGQHRAIYFVLCLGLIMALAYWQVSPEFRQLVQDLAGKLGVEFLKHVPRMLWDTLRP